MFTRSDKKRGTSVNGSDFAGQVRVLVVGDAGVGKSSLVYLLLHGRAAVNPRHTVGCAVDVKYLAYGDSGNPSSSSGVSKDQNFFVELWDVSGHDNYKDCRSLFYSQINGVIFVHDLSQRSTKANLQKWATEVATLGTFSAPLPSGNVAGLPVPFLVIGNKADIALKIGGSSGNLVDVARQWVEKQGFLPSADELPVAETFPGSGGLVSAAKEGRLDIESVQKFFSALIRRRYFGEDMAPKPEGLRVNMVEDTSSYHSTRGSSNNVDALSSHKRLSRDSYGRYSSPFPTLLPPPLPYPLPPLSASEARNGAKTNSFDGLSNTNSMTGRLDMDD